MVFLLRNVIRDPSDSALFTADPRRTGRVGYGLSPWLPSLEESESQRRLRFKRKQQVAAAIVFNSIMGARLEVRIKSPKTSSCARTTIKRMSAEISVVGVRDLLVAG